MQQPLLQILPIIVVITIWFISRLIFRVIYNRYLEPKKSIGLTYFKYVVEFVLACIAICYIMSMFKTTSKILSVFLASSGLLVAILGFAAQESLGDIVNGFTIMIFRPFEVNDRITLKNNNITGVVKAITPQHVILKTYTNSYITIPNSVINKDIIENYNLKNTETRSFVDLEVAYDTDLEKAIKVVQECVSENELVIKSDDSNDVLVQVRDFAPSGIALRINVWTASIEDNFKACSDIRVALVKRFAEEGIEIPYPHLDVMLPKEITDYYKNLT